MPYQHVLVAIDLTDECDPVMLRAQKLATSSAAKLSVVHIVEPMAMAFGGDVPMDLSMLQQQQFDQARERLDTFVKKHPERTSRLGLATGLHGQRRVAWRAVRCAGGTLEKSALGEVLKSAAKIAQTT